ncbi:MAG: hypothetical protein MUE40_16220 [Anaerolineae bacterium]|nr:hypothetical protein [Anaerolineae bacterium]
MDNHQPGATNIFNLTQPEHYRCQMLHYHARLSRLYLRVYQGAADQPAFFVLLTDVAYVDCPVTWQGANFSVAAAEDCIALLLEAGLIGKAILQFPGAYASITDYARLYQVAGGSRTIRLIAGSASRLQHLPDGL